jgi:hypothetical protein
MEAKKKKIYEFTLLKKRHLFIRLDLLLVVAISAVMTYNFGWQMANKENLLATGMLILTIFVNGVLVLLNFWTVAANEFYAFAKLKPTDIESCTHVKAKMINQKQNTTK